MSLPSYIFINVICEMDIPHGYSLFMEYYIMSTSGKMEQKEIPRILIFKKRKFKKRKKRLAHLNLCVPSIGPTTPTPVKIKKQH